MGQLRGVIGSKTFAAYMALYHGGSGDVTLFEKLRALMGSLEVSDRMPDVSSGAQKGMITRNAGGQPIRIYTWGSLQLIRDPYSGAGTGKVTVTAVQLVSDPLYIPHGVAQVKEVTPQAVVVGGRQWPRSRSSQGQRSAGSQSLPVFRDCTPENRRASSG